MQMLSFLRLGKSEMFLVLSFFSLSRTESHSHVPHSLGDPRVPIREILGPEVGARLKPIWGLDPEGEIQGVWRDVGIPRVWCMMGKNFISSSIEGMER